MDESHKFGRHQGRLNTELQRPTELLAHLPLIEVMHVFGHVSSWHFSDIEAMTTKV